MSTFKKIIPVLNRILVSKVEPQTKTQSGIILKSSQEANMGVVMECGPGTYDSNGKLMPMVIKIGDRVLLPDYGGIKVKI